MHWLRLALSVTEADADAAEAVLMDAGAVAVTLLDDADQPLLEPAPGATPLWRRVRMEGLFESDRDAGAVADALRRILGRDPDLRAELLEDRDWVRAWMDDYHPMRFGERLWICPSGRRVEAPDAIVVELDPGLAFGTGTHATTALCLDWLDANPPRDARVVDYGCGSGILAIAAARLGARRVDAVDIDPQAEQATVDNGRRNGVGNVVRITPPDGLAANAADLLMANILARPLVELAAHFAGLVCPGGALVLSGLLLDQAGAVRQAYASAFDLGHTSEREGWVCLAGWRRSS